MSSACFIILGEVYVYGTSKNSKCALCVNLLRSISFHIDSVYGPPSEKSAFGNLRCTSFIYHTTVTWETVK